jgi:ADP-ribose pyrophosphatase YjhB (NUDIX family)
MNVTQQLALWADELRALTGNGLRFVKSQYDESNYKRIRQIAAGMFALADGRQQKEVEPKLINLLGHYTPMVMGDALAINEDGAILLIQRSDNGLWAAPGGAFDVGETAAEGVVRECLEETGWKVEPLALIGVFDSRVVGTFVGQHVYHFNFLCRPVSPSMKKPSHNDEQLAMGWFSEKELPPLSPGHRLWVPNAFRFWRGEITEPYFDRFSPGALNS